MYQCTSVLDIARQPLWRYVKGRHRSFDDTWSSATNLNKYYYLFRNSTEQLRWRPLTYRHRGCRATSQRAFKFLVANVTYKMTTRFFLQKTLKMVFFNLRREISPLRVSKKYLRWCRRSRRIEWYPS
jgi:hypothetical protein